MIQRGSVRVMDCGTEGQRYLRFEALGSDAAWHVVCATGLVDTVSIWNPETTTKGEDPFFEWKETGSDQPRVSAGFFDRVSAGSDGFSLVLTKDAGDRQIEETVSVEDRERIHVRVRCTAADAAAGARPFQLGRLLTHIYFVPEGKAARSAEPLDFAWLPLLHKEKDHVCGDHFFRSPAVMAASGDFFAAIVPDLDVLQAHRSGGHALDLRVTDTLIEAPRLSYGLCPWRVDGHVYATHPPDLFHAVDGSVLVYEFDLFAGCERDHRHALQLVTSFLWEKYGARYLEDVRPQVLPFEEYGRRYVYVEELRKSVKWTADSARAGIDNIDRRGANFHAWENDLNVAYGIKHYGAKWGDRELERTADGIVRMYLHSPRREGAFPCVHNFRTGQYEGTLFWTARSADPLKGYDTAAMGVTAWWSLVMAEDFGDDGELLAAAESCARFLAAHQLETGAIPTYFHESLLPARQLRESATTCISGAVLARVARLTGREELREAAVRAGRFALDKVVPGLVFDDFEAYYSCSPKPLHAIDYWTGIRPHCNLSLQWGCDQMLSLYQLTGERHWMETGEYLLGILSLYQQVWSSPLYGEYLFGGFGVMNTDGEWNDGRQARFVPTYADYYLATGKIEYLERAVAACRASFALCDIPENHENGINALTFGENIDPRKAGCGRAVPGRGYAPENIHHHASEFYDGRYKGLWTGMNWSAGGGLAASAFLERHFGSVCADLQTGRALGIDGFRAISRSWNGRTAEVEITSSLAELKSPFRGTRTCRVTAPRAPDGTFELVLNGRSFGPLNAAQLRKGLEITV